MSLLTVATCRAKAHGLSPAKCPAKNPAKKLPGKNPVSDSQTPPSKAYSIGDSN